MNNTLKTLQKTARMRSIEAAEHLHILREETCQREGTVEKQQHAIRELTIRPMHLLPEQETARFHCLRAEHAALAESESAFAASSEMVHRCEDTLQHHVKAMKRFEKQRVHQAETLRKAHDKILEKQADEWILLQWGQR